MTKIKDIVEINSQAVLSPAIQLAWYNDPTKKAENDELVGGYVFGNGINRQVGSHWESSSLPVFEKIRDSFNSSQSSNIFTVVARYGHGKSHFALVLANYFGLSSDSPVVESIINHIETCSNKPTAKHFRDFKEVTKRPQLVVTLAGQEFQDLRQGFLQALRRALDAAGHSDLPIKSVSTEASKWLKSLKPDDLEKADNFLSEKHKTDVDSLVAALDQFESGKEVIVKDLSREILGIQANFGADVNLKEVILSTVRDLCEGKDAPFHKMLILFDELGIYAERWCHHQIASGGSAPQEMFEACADRPDKICFVGFIQRELSEFVKRYSNDVQTEFKKWAGRIQSDAIYHLISNLEEVISKLLKKNDEWTRVIEDFSPTLRKESDMARESVQRYFETWKEQQFYETVTRDCFPLHPLTTGLLCSFDFTQGSRTIIGAVASMLRSAEEIPVSDGGRLRWIRPIELVEVFKNDFDDSSDFAALDNALGKSLTTDADPVLIDVLKALFLFRETKMTKQNKYEHAELLAQLSGYTLDETREALGELQDKFDAVRYSADRREYEFTGILSGRGIVLDKAKSAIVGKRIDSFVRSLERLDAFKILETGDTFNPQNNSQAREFKDDFAVKGDEWFLASRYLDATKLSIDEVKKLCKKTFDDNEARGTVIYIVSGSAAELDQARDQAEKIFRQLKEADYTHPLVIAVPTEAATKLEKQVLIKEYITNGMSSAEREHFAESHQAALTFTNKELSEELVAHLRSVEYVVPEELSLQFGRSKKSLDEIADALFTSAYKFRPPSNSDSMKPSATTGNSATAEIARQMIVNELNFDSFNTAKQNIINHVLKEGKKKWGILDAYNKIQEPKNPLVKQGWSFLSKNISKTDWSSFKILITKLMLPPYGYDEYTSTFLIAAWIGRHKHELAFKDSSRTPTVRRVGALTQPAAQANLKLGELQNNLNRSKEFIRYLQNSVWVQNSGHEIQSAAKEYLEEIQNVTSAAEGRELFEQAGQILQTLADGDSLIEQIKESLEDLAVWLAATEGAEKQLIDLRNVVISNKDISSLIRTQNILNSFGSKNGMNSNSVFVDTLKLSEEKIKDLANQQSKVNLSRIESYEAVRGDLEKNRQSLNQAGRADLEKLFITALERVEKEYKNLQTEVNEKPFLNEINALQVNGVSLSNLLENSKRIEQILEKASSDTIENLARSKQNQLKEQIKKLRNFVESLPSQIDAVKDIRTSDDLRTKIYQNQKRYDGTPEAEIIIQHIEKLTSRITELKAERDRKTEEENERRRLEMEKETERRRLEIEKEDERRRQEDERRRQELETMTAQSITKEFQKITDSERRFNCLVEMIHTAKNKGLDDEQIRTLQGLLN